MIFLSQRATRSAYESTQETRSVVVAAVAVFVADNVAAIAAVVVPAADEK